MITEDTTESSSNHSLEVNCALEVLHDLLGAVVCARISAVSRRDYVGIILDGNAHRAICRLYFRNNQTYLGTINCHKVETLYKIADVNGITLHANEICQRTAKYV